MTNFTPLPQRLLKAIADSKRQEKYPNLKRGNTVAVGRPEEFKEEYADEAFKYIKEMQGKLELISLEGFCLRMDLDDEAVIRWANKLIDKEKGAKISNLAHPRFHEAIKRIRLAQKQQLISDGMYGGKKVNATMAIFLLKVNHGMIETEHIDHTTNGKELPTPIYGSKSTTTI